MHGGSGFPHSLAFLPKAEGGNMKKGMPLNFLFVRLRLINFAVDLEAGKSNL